MTRTQRTSTTVNASAADVWRILADEFVDISQWAGGVISSVPNPASPQSINGSPVGGRVCDIKGVGLTDERIVTFDPDRREIAYTVRAKGMPSFVESLTSTWTIAPDGAARSRVDMRIVAVTRGFMGAVGSIPLGRMLARESAGLSADLKRHAETRAAA